MTHFSLQSPGSWPDNIFCLEFFDDIDNLAEPFWDIDGPKTTPKNNLTQFSLHYRGLRQTKTQTCDPPVCHLIWEQHPHSLPLLILFSLPLLTSSSSHSLFLAAPSRFSSLFSAFSLCILAYPPSHASRSRLHPSSFIRPLSPSSLCHSSLLLHLAPLIISSSIIPSSSFSLSSSVLHPLHARSPVLCCVSRVRHAPRPKGFTNRRRVTTLPLPALLRRAPAVRRTRVWPCG